MQLEFDSDLLCRRLHPADSLELHPLPAQQELPQPQHQSGGGDWTGQPGGRGTSLLHPPQCRSSPGYWSKSCQGVVVLVYSTLHSAGALSGIELSPVSGP